jgi:hypothetical protein
MRHREPTLIEYLAALLPVNKPAGRRRASLPNHAGITLGGSQMDTVLALFKSRKFWAAIAGLILIVVQEFMPSFPLDAEQVTNVIYVVVAFIIGTGLEDARPVG